MAPAQPRAGSGGRPRPSAAVVLPPFAVVWTAAMGSLAGVLQAQGSPLWRAFIGAAVGVGVVTVLVAHADQVAKGRTALALLLVVAARSLSRMDWPASRDESLEDGVVFLLLVLGTSVRLCMDSAAPRRASGCIDAVVTALELGGGRPAQLEHGIVERVDQRPPSARDREGIAGSEHDVAQIVVQRQPKRARTARHVERRARWHFEQVAAEHRKAAGVVETVHGVSPMQDANDYTEHTLQPPMVIRHATHASSECEQRT